jgi:hypothetical protein
VEPGLFYDVFGNRGKRQLELRRKMRPGPHYYHYFMHPVLGLINARVATWFPYDIHICFNGRDWLARRMDQAGIGYKRCDNRFTWIEDVAAARKLMEQETRMNWPDLPRPIVASANPAHGKLLGGLLPEYYHSVDQSEWATDVLFKGAAASAVTTPTALGRLSEPLCRPVTWNGKRVRALIPLSTEDHRLLAAVARGEFVLKGFRNRDPRQLLEGDAPRDKKALRRQSGAITRKPRMPRAHGLIKKAPRTHRYLLSDKGRQAITALLAAREADTSKLAAAA